MLYCLRVFKPRRVEGKTCFRTTHLHKLYSSLRLSTRFISSMAEYNYPRDFTSSRSATELWPNISLQANLCQENRFGKCHCNLLVGWRLTDESSDLLKDFTFRMADDQYQPSRIINAIQVPGNSCSGPSTNTVGAGARSLHSYIDVSL